MLKSRIIKFLKGYVTTVKEPFMIKKLIGAFFSTARFTSFISY